MLGPSLSARFPRSFPNKRGRSFTALPNGAHHPVNQVNKVNQVKEIFTSGSTTVPRWMRMRSLRRHWRRRRCGLDAQAHVTASRARRSARMGDIRNHSRIAATSRRHRTQPTSTPAKRRDPVKVSSYRVVSLCSELCAPERATIDGIQNCGGNGVRKCRQAIITSANMPY